MAKREGRLSFPDETAYTYSMNDGVTLQHFLANSTAIRKYAGLDYLKAAFLSTSGYKDRVSVETWERRFHDFVNEVK